jgi:hypothetical protein
MGDLSDMNDCDRVMRSKQGKAHLDEIVVMLKGRTITDVTFSNEVNYIATTLVLDDNSEFLVFQPSLEVDALREEFADAIREEYEKDYPERQKEIHT